MKSKYIILTLICFLLISCALKKSIDNKDLQGDIQWGVRWSKAEITDTSFFHAQGIDANTDCFPSIGFLTKDSSTRTVSIYNRWGKLQYSSKESQKPWICNSNNNTGRYDDGTYFYILVEQSLTNINSIDTLQGQITLYRK